MENTLNDPGGYLVDYITGVGGIGNTLLADREYYKRGFNAVVAEAMKSHTLAGEKFKPDFRLVNFRNSWWFLGSEHKGSYEISRISVFGLASQAVCDMTLSKNASGGDKRCVCKIQHRWTEQHKLA